MKVPFLGGGGPALVRMEPKFGEGRPAKSRGREGPHADSWGRGDRIEKGLEEGMLHNIGFVGAGELSQHLWGRGGNTLTNGESCASRCPRISMREGA